MNTNKVTLTCLLICYIISVCNAQAFVNLINSTSFITDNFISSDCTTKTTIKLSSNQLIDIQNTVITVIKPSVGPFQTSVSVISQKSISDQLFVLLYELPAGSNELLINVNIPSQLNVNLTLPGQLQCRMVQSENFQITKFSLPSKSTYKKLTKLLVEFNFTEQSGYRPFECFTDAPISCDCYLEASTTSNPAAFFNKWYCDLNLGLTYTSMNPKITIYFTLSVYGYSQQVEIDNPYPYNIDYIPYITTYYFPANFYYFNEDFQMQSYRYNYYTQLLTVRNMTDTVVLAYEIPNEDYKLVGRAPEGSVYAITTKTNMFNGTIETKVLDSTAWPFLNYTQTFVRFNFTHPDGTYSVFNDISNNFLVYQINLPIPHNYIASFSCFGYPNDIPLPYSSSINSTSIYTYAMPISRYFYGECFGALGPLGNRNSFIIDPQASIQYSNITISSIKYRIVSPMSYIMTISVNTGFPLQRITVLSGEMEISLKDSDRISGNSKRGIYQKELQITSKPIMIHIYSVSGENIVFNEGEPYDSNFTIVPSPSKYDNSKIPLVSDLTFFKFNQTVVNNTLTAVYNTLYFNFSKYIPELKPYLTFDKNEEYIYQGRYDNDLKLFVINFKMEKWLAEADYFLIKDIDNPNIVLESKLIQSHFNNSEDTILTSQCVGCENIPPMLFNIDPSVDNATTLGWKIRISEYNGFVRGEVEIITDLDIEPYIIELTPKNLISGDVLYGVYEFFLDLTNITCVTQKFIINKINLYDTSPQMIEIDSINQIRGYISENNLVISHFCSGGPQELKAPELVSLEFNNKVEVGGYDRPIEISFTTFDESGISKRHNPMIYLSSENEDTLQIQSNLISFNDTHNNYIVKGQLPFGFGLNYIYLSIYGIVDNQLNKISYTMADLAAKSFPYYFIRIFNTSIPYLERHSSIFRTGGSLTIYGRSLSSELSQYKQLLMIDYHDGKGYQYLSSSFSSEIIIQIQQIKPFNSEYITIQIENNGIKSNEMNIYPIEPFMLPLQPTTSPTPTPTTTSKPPTSLCPGTPACNNRGACKSNGCICNYLYYGPSCSSQTIPINPPSPQPNPTTGSDFNITNGNSIKSMIEIIEVREIDNLNNIIQRHSIDKWNFTDLSSILSKPTYVYQSQLNGTTTNIIVTIEFFENETKIEFGNQNITISPSSIKYSIELSKYSFTSKVNLLQVVMESTIIGTSSDSCSSQQFGSESDSKDDIKWIKMNIDKTSLYGRFIDIGIIDGRVSNITNRIIEDDESTTTTQFRSMKVGITIPNYDNNVYLDPDFSNLIDVENENSDFLCKSKKKLSSGAIAGIVVGGVVFLSLVIGGSIFLHKRIKNNRENKNLESKLSKIKNNK